MKYFKFFPVVIGIVLLTSWIGVFSSYQEQDPLLSFMRDAAGSGQFEVEAGKLAQQKATKPEVKEFARQMVTDHGKANQELKRLAAQKGITLDTMDSRMQQLYMELAKKSGAAFDKAYVNEMAKSHDITVNKFNAAVKSIADSDVRAWASKTLPTLKAHQSHAHKLKDKFNEK